MKFSKSYSMTWPYSCFDRSIIDAFINALEKITTQRADEWRYHIITQIYLTTQDETIWMLENSADFDKTAPYSAKFSRGLIQIYLMPEGAIAPAYTMGSNICKDGLYFYCNHADMVIVERDLLRLREVLSPIENNIVMTDGIASISPDDASKPTVSTYSASPEHVIVDELPPLTINTMPNVHIQEVPDLNIQTSPTEKQYIANKDKKAGRYEFKRGLLFALIGVAGAIIGSVITALVK